MNELNRFMARRPRVFAAGLLDHVIVRGNQRRLTFRDDHDYNAYLDRLEKYRAKFQVKIYAQPRVMPEPDSAPYTPA